MAIKIKNTFTFHNNTWVARVEQLNVKTGDKVVLQKKNGGHAHVILIENVGGQNEKLGSYNRIEKRAASLWTFKQATKQQIDNWVAPKEYESGIESLYETD